MMNNPGGQPFQIIDSLTYQQHFNGNQPYLLDVREVQEFVTGRIPGAVNIPLGQLAERVAEIPTDQTIVVICAQGVRSAMAATFLAQTGYTDLYNLIDGTFGWRKHGLPLEV
jgi:adenylyltransferase/sulfurtransferase